METERRAAALIGFLPAMAELLEPQASGAGASGGDWNVAESVAWGMRSSFAVETEHRVGGGGGNTTGSNGEIRNGAEPAKRKATRSAGESLGLAATPRCWGAPQRQPEGTSGRGDEERRR